MLRILSLLLAIAATTYAIQYVTPVQATFDALLQTTGDAFDEIEEQTNAQCLSHFHSAHLDGGANHADVLRSEVASFQTLVEKSLVYRTHSMRVANELKAKLALGQPLSGADLALLNVGTNAHLQLRDTLLKTGRAHACWLANDFAAANALDDATRLKGVMLSLAAALVLYDNYLLAISVFDEDTKLRQVLNKSDTGYDIPSGQLEDIARSYRSVLNRARIRDGMRFYESALARAQPEVLDHPDILYLTALISQSPSYNTTRVYSPLAVIGSKITLFSNVTEDHLKNVSEDGIDLLSMLFGNTVGLIESRKGKLYNDDAADAFITRELAAGDILLEKTPFRLTDKLIPGHWGHAAIWVGTQNELQELGIWNHPKVIPYHDEIRRGKLIVEALRTGVQMSSLQAFLNVDDLVALRQNDLSETERAGLILRAFRQLGKAYDFNFDVETTDKIICSELVYLTHTKAQWPTDNAFGRTTISPDNIAEKALDNGPFEVVLLFHDGKRVTKQPDKTLKRLLTKSL